MYWDDFVIDILKIILSFPAVLLAIAWMQREPISELIDRGFTYRDGGGRELDTKRQETMADKGPQLPNSAKETTDHLASLEEVTKQLGRQKEDTIHWFFMYLNALLVPNTINLLSTISAHPDGMLGAQIEKYLEEVVQVKERAQRDTMRKVLKDSGLILEEMPGVTLATERGAAFLEWRNTGAIPPQTA